MPTTSVICPIQPSELSTVIPYARLAENTSGQRLWCGQSVLVETHHVFAALSGIGFDIGYGSAVTLTPLRHPMTAAICARSTALLSGRTYIAGIGPGPADFQQQVLGAPYAKPVATTRDYVTMMRTLLDGEIVAEPGGPWPTEGLSLPVIPTSDVEIGLGVLRAPMARLAGKVADWAMTWLTPLSYLRDRIAPVMADSAAQAGRPAPRIAAVVHCAVARPGRDLTSVALAAAHRHLTLPHYTDMLNQAGVPVDPADPRAGASLLVEHGVLASGTPEEIAATVSDYHAAGVEEVVVNVAGVHITEGPGAALRDLSAILTAVDK